MTKLDFKYKGKTFVTAIADDMVGNPEVERYARERLEREAKYQIDEKPAIVKRMDDRRDAIRERDAARAAALEHMRIVVGLETLELLESLHVTHLVVSRADLSKFSPLLGRPLAKMIHGARAKLDQNILRRFWEAEDRLDDVYSRVGD